MVADQPFLTHEHLNMLIGRFESSPGKIVALSSHGEPRNPVLIPFDIIEDLEKLEGDEGARKLVKKNSGTVLIDVADPQVFVDVDTKDSLLEFQKSNEN